MRRAILTVVIAALIVGGIGGAWLAAQSFIDVHPGKVEIASSAADALKVTGGVQVQSTAAGALDVAGGAVVGIAKQYQVRNSAAGAIPMAQIDGGNNMIFGHHDSSGVLKTTIFAGTGIDFGIGSTATDVRLGDQSLSIRNGAGSLINLLSIDASNHILVGSDDSLGVNNTIIRGAQNVVVRTTNADRWSFNTTGHLVPASSATYDVGSSASRVRSLHVGDGVGTVPAIGFTSNTGINWISGTSAIEIVFGGVRKFQITANQLLLEDNAAVSDVNLVISRGSVFAEKVSGVAAQFARSADDGAIVELIQGGTAEGSISVSGTTVSYNAFVGSHYTQLRPGQRQPAVGSVIVSTGQRIRGRTREARAGEKFVYVDPSSARNQKGVYGVWFGSLNQTAKKMSWGDPARLVYQVAGLGLYQVLVTDTCGNIANGELLAASPRSGLAERQCTDTGTTYDGRVQDHTLGKALVDVDWSKVTPDRNGIRRALIPAIIMAG